MEHTSELVINPNLPLWTILPFIGLLLSVAFLPLFVPHFWRDNFGKVCVFWAAAFALPFMVFFHHKAFLELVEIMLLDYIPFIILLWTLYTIAGGILISWKIQGTPAINSLLLLVRAIAAENEVNMPGFFGYILYSLIILVPIFLCISWIFF